MLHDTAGYYQWQNCEKSRHSFYHFDCNHQTQTICESFSINNLMRVVKNTENSQACMLIETLELEYLWGQKTDSVERLKREI
jgi:hypothetical protein